MMKMPKSELLTPGATQGLRSCYQRYAIEISYTKYEGDLTSLQIYEQSKRFNAKH